MDAEAKVLPREIRERMERYVEALLAFGMQEARRGFSAVHRFFYKTVTEFTAFIVNIKCNEFYLELTYGYSSVGFIRMVGNENALAELGVSDEDITIREKLLICDDSDETPAKHKIEEMYRTYLRTEKEALLLCAKEKRKSYLQQITEKLKPMGFRKKGNVWAYELENGYFLSFYAQKSAYSDQYYFNIHIGKSKSPVFGECYATRVLTAGTDLIDWQAYYREEFDSLLDKSVIPKLKSILHTPLWELGKTPAYQEGCHCNRRKCEACWMEKNLWDVRPKG